MIKLHITVGIKGDKPEVLYCGTDGEANLAAYDKASVELKEKGSFDTVAMFKKPDWDKRKRKPSREQPTAAERRAARAELDKAVSERNQIEADERAAQAKAQEEANREAYAKADAKRKAQIAADREARQKADAALAKKKAEAGKPKGAKPKKEKLTPA